MPINKMLGTQFRSSITPVARRVLGHAPHVSDRHVMTHMRMPGVMTEQKMLRFKSEIVDHYKANNFQIPTNLASLLGLTKVKDFEEVLARLVVSPDEEFSSTYEEEGAAPTLDDSAVSILQRDAKRFGAALPAEVDEEDIQFDLGDGSVVPAVDLKRALEKNEYARKLFPVPEKDWDDSNYVAFRSQLDRLLAVMDLGPENKLLVSRRLHDVFNGLYEMPESLQESVSKLFALKRRASEGYLNRFTESNLNKGYLKEGLVLFLPPTTIDYPVMRQSAVRTRELGTRVSSLASESAVTDAHSTFKSWWKMLRDLKQEHPQVSERLAVLNPGLFGEVAVSRLSRRREILDLAYTLFGGTTTDFVDLLRESTHLYGLTPDVQLGAIRENPEDLKLFELWTQDMVNTVMVKKRPLPDNDSVIKRANSFFESKINRLEQPDELGRAKPQTAAILKRMYAVLKADPRNLTYFFSKYGDMLSFQAAGTSGPRTVSGWVKRYITYLEGMQRDLKFIIDAFRELGSMSPEEQSRIAPRISTLAEVEVYFRLSSPDSGYTGIGDLLVARGLSYNAVQKLPLVQPKITMMLPDRSTL